MAAMLIDRNIARGLNALGYWIGVIFKITGPSSYTTGGEALVASDLKLGVIEYVADVHLRNATTSAVIGRFDYTNNKMQFFWDSASATVPLEEVASTTDLSAYTGRAVAFGKG